jgi:hypothetical protein
VLAGQRQGAADELVRATGRAPGWEGAGGAHRGRRSSVRRCGGSVRWHAAGSSLEKGSMVMSASSESCGEGRER